MDHVLLELHYLVITPWKIVGFLGLLLFTSRWFVQMYATRKHRKVTMPTAFWWLSISGSALLVSYFTFGKNDSVGIISNAFPAMVALYNLAVHLRAKRSGETPAPGSAPGR